MNNCTLISDEIYRGKKEETFGSAALKLTVGIAVIVAIAFLSQFV